MFRANKKIGLKETIRKPKTNTKLEKNMFSSSNFSHSQFGSNKNHTHTHPTSRLAVHSPRPYLISFKVSLAVTMTGYRTRSGELGTGIGLCWHMHCYVCGFTGCSHMLSVLSHTFISVTMCGYTYPATF